MKFVHISDLHLGKRLYGFSLLEDQKFILDKVIEIIDDEKPDAVLIAGDIYDKPVPLVQAVELFDSFIVRLSARKVQTFIISGNHDSAGRLSFGGRLMDAEGVHISPAYAGKASSFSLEDEYGPVDNFLLPFLKPQTAAPFFEEEMGDYSSCLRAAIRRMDIRPGVRKVLIAHQFVTGASRSDSEEVNVGGLDNVDAAVFEDFDYVALGHIHSPQNVGDPRIRYCGTPLKYSFSEAGQSLGRQRAAAQGSRSGQDPFPL